MSSKSKNSQPRRKDDEVYEDYTGFAKALYRMLTDNKNSAVDLPTLADTFKVNRYALRMMTELGMVVETGKLGNAKTYTWNDRHGVPDFNDGKRIAKKCLTKVAEIKKESRARLKLKAQQDKEDFKASNTPKPKLNSTDSEGPVGTRIKP